ncbi:hypothetical protein [Nocardia paucivorans]|uniref:hypothetical protein n=1 Tax=Nocardia paucivorans TaxID=114259 RepID=UPI0002F41877|nr:hypothetical protein [Nocardia paucivorans]
MKAGGSHDPGTGDSPRLPELSELVEPLDIRALLPADAPDSVPGGTDFGTALQIGLGLALALLDDSDPSGRRILARLEQAAVCWARQEIPLEVVQHALHEGVKSGLGLRDSPPSRGVSGLVDGCFVVDVLETLTTTVSRAYVAELRSAQ